MRREIFALMLLAVITGAALDQSYIQTVSRNGNSSIERTMEISLFSNQLLPGAFERMAEACLGGDALDCSVDAENETITMREDFSSGGYYTMTADYGLPFITYTMTISKVPTDKFSMSLRKLLDRANATQNADTGGSARAIDLSDKEGNADTAGLLRLLKANLTYTITMPAPISMAAAGEVSGDIKGQTVAFDLVSVMAESEPMVITSQEPNYGYIIAIAGIVVLSALALLFFGTKPGKKKRKK